MLCMAVVKCFLLLCYPIVGGVVKSAGIGRGVLCGVVIGEAIFCLAQINSMK